MASKRAVFFDLGNTLLYFDGEWPEVFAQADQLLVSQLIDAGLNLDQEEFTREFRTRMNAYYQQREAEFIEHTTTYVLENLLSEFGVEQVSESILQPALAKMYAVSQAHWRLEAEAIACLNTLKESGYRLGIISNAGNDADVQKLVDKTEIREYFEFVITSAACGIRKPNPRIFAIALERLDLGPEDAVMVGDKLGADILGARNASIYSIWVTRRADTPVNSAHSETIKPDAAITSLDELPELLERII